jgi:hypothetical protein
MLSINPAYFLNLKWLPSDTRKSPTIKFSVQDIRRHKPNILHIVADVFPPFVHTNQTCNWINA